MSVRQPFAAVSSALRSARPRLVFVVCVAIVGLIVSLCVTVHELRGSPPTVYAYMKDASPLIKGNDVKSAGVKVGSVGSIEVEHGEAKIGLVLNDDVLPLHRDATIRIRPVGLLGERYVDLDRGSPSAPVLAKGAAIPVTQTSTATDLDEVLDTVDAPTGEALSYLVTTLGEGVLGRGKDANAAIKALAPALLDTNRLAAILKDQNGVLDDLLDSVQPVASQLAIDNGKQLDQLIDAANDALATTALKDDQLNGTLRELPGALHDAEPTLAALARAAGSTTPVLAALRPTTDDLVQLSGELNAFSKTANSALTSINPVLDKATVLLKQAEPVATTLSELSPGLLATAGHTRILGTAALDNLTTVLDFVRDWALTTNGQDGLSHYFRAHLVVTTDAASGLLPNGPNLIPPLSPVPNKGLGGALQDPLGTVGGALGGLTGNQDGNSGGVLGGLGGGVLGGLLGGLTGNGRANPSAAGSSSAGATVGKNPQQNAGSATGLNRTQERSLLAYLIGGTSS